MHDYLTEDQLMEANAARAIVKRFSHHPIVKVIPHGEARYAIKRLDNGDVVANFSQQELIEWATRW